MNIFLRYSLIAFILGLFDLTFKSDFSPGIGFGLALIFLGVGLYCMGPKDKEDEE